MNTKRIMAPVDMEAELERAFRPVRPSRKFVQTVRGRIRRFAPQVAVATHFDDTSRFWVLVGGLISGALLLAAGLRAVFYILNKSKM